MDTELFNFHLPDQLIAQEPLPERDSARLLLLDRANKSWQDRVVRDVPGLLQTGDLLILNDTRVIPARIRATRDSSGGKIEFLLLPPEMERREDGNLGRQGAVAVQQPTTNSQQPASIRRVLTRSGGKLKVGESFTLNGAGIKATLLERHGEAGDVVEFHCSEDKFSRYLDAQGEVPLPPYIRRPAGPSIVADRERYQTVFAQTPGAVAAPTAGLHFTERLFDVLKTRGVNFGYVTLHVGPGTFRPVKADKVEEHFVDPEPYFIAAQTVEAILKAKREKRRVIAVGTTSLRALEGSGLGEIIRKNESAPQGLTGQTNLFVYPPREFGVVDGLLTNFHIPKSSLLMLICAFASPGRTDGIEFIQRAYEHAVASQYRFYSYGDACLIL